MNCVHRNLWVQAALIFIPLVGLSCSLRSGQVEVVSQGGANTVGAPGGAIAVVAAARANEISLFGDYPLPKGGTAFTRTSMALSQHTFSEVGIDFDPDVSRTGGKIVFASTRHSERPNLYIKRVDGVAVTQLTSDPSADIQPVFSPDGTKVAFASNRMGNWDIWVISVEGGAAIQITTERADEVHPTWSPDGSRLAYCSLPVGGGPWELWISSSGAGPTRKFVGFGVFPQWAPVDDTILFQRARERGSHWFSIWTLTLVDGEPRYPTEVASSASEAIILPAWSPDAKSIVYVSTSALGQVSAQSGFAVKEGVFDLWLMQANGRGKARLTDGHTANFSPAFGRDGRIYFTSNRSGHENIWSLKAPTFSTTPGPATTEATMQQDGSAINRRTVSLVDGL